MFSGLTKFVLLDINDRFRKKSFCWGTKTEVQYADNKSAVNDTVFYQKSLRF